MNALGNPIGSPNGVQREQTMEEILASIRKIIESNEANTNPSESVEAEARAAEIEARTFEPVEVFEPQNAVPQPVQIDVPAYAAPAIAVAPLVEAPVAAPVPSLQSEMARLMSQSPERRVAAAFDDLNTAFMKSKQMPLESVAEDMLRPMMQEWLDNNLPNLVERLVREEITRIARGDI